MLWVVGVPLLIAAGLFIELFLRSSRRLAQAELETEAVIREIRSRTRAPLKSLGPGIEGDAWDHYPSPTTLDIVDLGSSLGMEWKYDPDRFEAVLKAHARDIEAIRLGLRCRLAVPRTDYEVPFADHYRSPPNEGVLLGYFLAAAAVHRHARQDDVEALVYVRMLLGLGQDYARGAPSEVIETLRVFEQRAAEAGRMIFAGHSLSAGDLESFAQDFDLLDASRPSALDALEVDDVRLRRALVEYGRSGRSRFEYPVKWSGEQKLRFLGSSRLAAVHALDHLSAVLAEVRALKALKPHGRHVATATMCDRWQDKNPLVIHSLGEMQYGTGFRWDSIGLMFRGLLRLAAAIAWYEADQRRLPGRLEDLVPKYIGAIPVCGRTGEPYRYAGGKVWSGGFDMDDDGGRQALRDTEDGDQVIEVRRK